MARIRTCDRESQVQRPNHYYTTEPPCVLSVLIIVGELLILQFIFVLAEERHQLCTDVRML